MCGRNSCKINNKNHFFSDAHSITAWPPQQLAINEFHALTKKLAFQRPYLPISPVQHANPYIALGEEWPLITQYATEENLDEENLATLLFKRPEDVTITPNSDRMKVPEKLTAISTRAPTTRKPSPVKLRMKPQTVQRLKVPPKNAFDIKLLKVQELSRKLQDKARYIIEQIMFVPGRHLINYATVEQKPSQTTSAIRLKSGWVTNKKLSAVPLPVHTSQKNLQDENRSSKLVKVDSVGMVSADQPITGYEAYFPDDSTGSGEEATLILEPQSRAIAGNGGTAISAPVSNYFCMELKLNLPKKTF